MDARCGYSYHAPAAGVTGDNEGAGNPPPVPFAAIEAGPGVSEAEFLRDVKRLWFLVTRYRKLKVDLAAVCAAAESLNSQNKKAATVFALVELLEPDMPSESLALVMGLFPEGWPTQLYNNAMRAVVAGAIAALRSADLENPEIEDWLTREIAARALDFTALQAMRWFFDYNSEAASVPHTTLEAFHTFRPGPSLSLTEAEAKERAARMLDTVAKWKAGRLTRKQRRRR